MTIGETLSTADVVKDLGLSKGTVSRWIIEGKIPAIKVGKNYRIPLEPYLKAKAALRNVQHEDPTAPAIARLISDWLNHLQNGPTPYASKTIEDYRHNLLRFVRLLGGVSNLQELFNKQAGIKAIEAIPPQSYAVRCHVLSSVVSFAKFVVAQRLIPESVLNDLQALRPKRMHPPRRTSLEDNQLPKLLEAIWTASGNSQYQRHLNHAIVKTMLLTGIRRKELTDLLLDDVDLPNRVLTVRLGKGRKYRQVGINAELLQVLQEYLPRRPKSASQAFFLLEKGTPIRPNYITYRIYRLARTAGIDLTVHGLRRSFASNAVMKGHPLALVSRALGHSQVSTTESYLLINQMTVIEAMKGW